MPTDRAAAARRGGLVALTLLLVAGAARAQAPDSLGRTEWPLNAGDVWVYQARVTSAVGAPALEESVVVRVLAAHVVGADRVAVVERLRPGRAPEVEYHRLSGSTLTIAENPERLAARVAGAPVDPADAQAALVFPLREGQRWGAPEMLTRGDGLYISTVGRPELLRLPGGSLRALPVRFRTLPDQVTGWYAPGLGLVRWEYVHHGLESAETWDLLEFTHAAVDTATLTDHIERRLVEFLARDGFWSRRAALAGDPGLQALLGPLTAEEDPEDIDGVRRLRLIGERSRVTIERLPDGTGRAWLLAIGNRERVWRRVEFALQRPTTAADAWSDLLSEAHADFEAAVRARTAGSREEAVAGVRRAAARIGTAITGLFPDARPDSASLLDAIRPVLRNAVGTAGLVTRYGQRVRVDRSGLRLDLEASGNGLLMTIRFESSGRTRIGAAPRLLVAGQSPRALQDADEEPSLTPCRLMTADWAPRRPGAEYLFLCSDRPGGVSRVELYAVDAAATPLLWSRTLPGGSARLQGDDLTLELDFERPAPGLSTVQRWREYWGPPPDDPGLELYPRPIRRERLDPPADRPVLRNP